ncbi:hypothetical protein PFISCL1PPCAC_21401, partial [Pristionchus fissidentatus]
MKRSIRFKSIDTAKDWCEMSRPKKPRVSFRNEAQFGDKDFLSLLPDDCLLNIVSLLDLESLDVLEKVNQKMRSFSKLDIIRFNKKHHYEALTISDRFSVGCSFELIHHQASLNYTYALVRAPMGNDYKEPTDPWHKVRNPPKPLVLTEEKCRGKTLND